MRRYNGKPWEKKWKYIGRKVEMKIAVERERVKQMEMEMVKGMENLIGIRWKIDGNEKSSANSGEEICVCT